MHLFYVAHQAVNNGASRSSRARGRREQFAPGRVPLGGRLSGGNHHHISGQDAVHGFNFRRIRFRRDVRHVHAQDGPRPPRESELRGKGPDVFTHGLIALAQFIEDVRNDCGVESALDAIEKFNVRFGCGLARTSRARTHGGCMVHGTLLLVMMDFSFA